MEKAQSSLKMMYSKSRNSLQVMKERKTSRVTLSPNSKDRGHIVKMDEKGHNTVFQVARQPVRK